MSKRPVEKGDPGDEVVVQKKRRGRKINEMEDLFTTKKAFFTNTPRGTRLIDTMISLTAGKTCILGCDIRLHLIRFDGSSCSLCVEMTHKHLKAFLEGHENVLSGSIVLGESLFAQFKQASQSIEYLNRLVLVMKTIRCSEHFAHGGHSTIDGTFIATVRYEFDDISREVFYIKDPKHKEVASQIDRDTLVDAVKVIEKHRGKSLGFQQNGKVSFTSRVFGAGYPDWLQLQREIAEVALEGTMACGIRFYLMEFETGCCAGCHKLTLMAFYDTIYKSGFYKGPCDIGRFVNIKLGPASRSFEFLDTLMKTVKVIRCQDHLDQPDRPLLGANIGEVEYVFRDLRLHASYRQL